MKAITTRVVDGEASATDGDGSRVQRLNVLDMNRDQAHKHAVLALCLKMGWTGRLQGGHYVSVRGRQSMVWTWLDEDWLVEASDDSKARVR